MSMIARIWTKTARASELLEAMEDPISPFTYSLEKRVSELERSVQLLEARLKIGVVDGATQQQASKVPLESH